VRSRIVASWRETGKLGQEVVSRRLTVIHRNLICTSSISFRATLKGTLTGYSLAKTHSASYDVHVLHFCTSTAPLRSPIMWEAIEISPAVHKVARRRSSLSFVSLRNCITKCLTDNRILEPHSCFIYSKYSTFCPFTYPSMIKPITTKVQHFYMTESTFFIRGPSY